MKTNLLSLIFSLLSLLAYGQQGQARREIPTAWIEKLQKYDYKTSANDLVCEFQTYIAPDSLARFEKEAFLSPMFVNLDEDKEMEVLLYIGGEDKAYYYSPHFFVLKQIKNKWQVIYQEQYFDAWGAYPSVQVMSNQTISKVFYFSACVERGSDVHHSRTYFFKVSQGKVYKFLDIPKRKSFAGGGQIHDTSTTIDAFEKGIWITYYYKVKVVLDNEQITLLDEKVLVSYLLEEKRYELPRDVTEEKLNFLNGKGSVRVFQKELEEVGKNGTEAQKKALKLFYNTIKKD
jgi:hypothetical protein